MASESDLYVAKEAATFEVGGSPVYVGPGTVVRAGHPIMAGREYLFEPLVIHFDVPPAAVDGDSEQPARRAPRTATR
jgi:hypothetical protein